MKTYERPTEALNDSVKPEEPIDDPKRVAREHIRKKMVEDFRVPSS